MNPIGDFIFFIALNYIGGTIRWILGSSWRTIFNKPKFSYSEYLWGPKKHKDHWDRYQGFTNGIIAFLAIFIIIYTTT